MMLTIRTDQLAALETDWERSRRVAFITRLRRELPAQVGAITEQQMERQVEDGCKAAEALGINDADHIYRFLRLRYLPASTWDRLGAQEMLIRVLTDNSLDAEHRLRFVEKNIVLEP